MDSDRWRRIEELFNQASSLPPPERSAFLLHACGGDTGLLAELHALLSAGGDTTSIHRPIGMETAALLDEADDEAWKDRCLGPWRITGLLGQGGMGAVYSAVNNQDGFELHAAIKLLRLGMTTPAETARFREERRILARLEHPHIARLLDGGELASPDGQGSTPYIVLERVDGLPITDYCASHSLDVPARLRLFLQVVAAVEYAHQRLVLHRDLKPANILVTASGEVKLLDFGIARLLDPAAGDKAAPTTQLVLTPEYASPEQVRGEPLVAAADVYSLGVVLYELLGGRRPYSFRKTDPLEMARIICEASPQPLNLGADLDNLTAKALEKDPARRYSSAAQLGEDIRRFLEGRPLLARGSSAGYRFAKFIRRNRLAAALVTVTTLSIVAGLAFSLYEARRATRSAALVRQLANTFVFEVYDAIARLPGATKTRELVVARALSYLQAIERDSPRDPRVQYEIGVAYKKIADVTGQATGANLGDSAAALQYYRRAESHLVRAVQANPGDEAARLAFLEVLQRQGQSLAYSGAAAEARSCYQRALTAAEQPELASRAAPPVRVQVANLLMNLSDLLRPAGDVAGAVRASDRALSILNTLYREHPDDVDVQHSLAVAHSSVARSRSFSNDLKGASEARRASIQLMEQVNRARPGNTTVQRDLLLAYGNLGDLLGSPTLPSLGDRSGAAEAYRRAVALAEALSASDSENRRAKLDLAIALSRLGHVIDPANHPEALDIYSRAIALFRSLETQDPNNATLAANLASTLEMQAERFDSAGDPNSAASSFRDAAAVCRGVLDRKPGEATAERVLIRILEAETTRLLRLNRPAEAAARARQALDLANARVSRSPFNSSLMKARASAIMASVSRPPDTCRWRRDSLTAWQSIENNPGFNVVYRRALDSARTAAAACSD